MRGGCNEKGGEGLGRRRLEEAGRGRRSEEGEIERLERWQGDKGGESQIKGWRGRRWRTESFLELLHERKLNLSYKTF